MNTQQSLSNPKPHSSFWDTVLEDVFTLFLSEDPLHERFNKIFLDDEGYVVATDGIALIYTESKHYKGHFVKLSDPPKWSSYREKETLKLKIERVDLSKWKDVDEEQEHRDDFECPTCGGDGTVEWAFENYTQNFDCPRCGGDGFSTVYNSVKTGKKTFGDYYVNIKGVSFKIHQINRLFNASEKLGEDIDLVNINAVKKYAHFKLGKVTILIMGSICEEYDKAVLKVH